MYHLVFEISFLLHVVNLLSLLDQQFHESVTGPS